MQLIEQVISIVAPHDCLVCGEEGRLLCNSCSSSFPATLPSRCYLCHRITDRSRTCQSCRHKSNVRSVYVRTNYSGVAKDIIYALKFERARAASEAVAVLTLQALPPFYDAVIVPVPTANNRRRQRGYDQAELIARELQKQTGLALCRGLHRSGSARQVGASRDKRRNQLEKAFWLQRPQSVEGKTVLLIDDVVTTGATLEAAAKVLRKAGAKHVDALVFAKA